MTSESFSAVIQAMTRPVERPSPVAVDERSLDLRQEVDKLSSITGGEPDWPKVASLGAALLGEVGKDLLVASYTAVALTFGHGIAGLASGLDAITNLLRNQAEVLTPSRAVARARALEWLIARVSAMLSAHELGPGDHRPLGGLEASVVVLQGASQELLAEHSPSFRSLRDAVRVLTEKLPIEPEGVDGGAESDRSVDPRSGSPATVVYEDVPTAPPSSVGVSVDPYILASPWLAAIEGASAVGSDPQGHERYAQLREELAKLNAMSGEVEVDWPMVSSLCDQILKQQAKDLQIAAWFAIACAHADGVIGLARGSAVVAELVVGFWPEIHPRRARPRKFATEWLVTQSAGFLATVEIEQLDRSALTTLSVMSTRLGEVLREHLADDAPSLRPLRDGIAQLEAKLEERERGAARASEVAEDRGDERSSERAAPATQASPEARPQEQHAEVAAPAPAPAPAKPVDAPSTAAPPADLSAIDGFLDATGETLQSAARTLREARSADPRAYRLLRAGLWIHLDALPPIRPDGNTAIPGMREQDRQQLEELATGQKWPGLLARCENLLVRHRLILDLQRFSALALAGLGAEYEAALVAVRGELRNLLTRLPELLSLRDADGAPLADALTRRWITTEILTGGTARAPRPEADSEDPEFWQGIGKRLKGKERSEALEEAQEKIARATSARRAFHLRLALGEACDEAGDPQVAVAIFGGLAEEGPVEIDRWETDAAVRYLSGFARNLHVTGRTAEAAAVLRRLARIDVVASATLVQEISPPTIRG